ncbi:MAG TPA: WGR domain-containing protein [Kofleriaceae bacterium]|nr:WGR domain-containing protein [Kofleriaceae bacterium]
MPRYEFSEGSSSKFWEIKLTGKSFTTTYGKLGASGQTTIKTFSSEAEAKKAHDKLIAEKVKKGYVLAGKKAKPAASAPAGDARNPALEAAIEADPYDTTAYSVLGDWLQGQGDPRGELIALQLAGKDKQARALIQKQADYFLGALADHQTTYDDDKRPAFEWRYGYIHGLRLSHNEYAEEGFEGRLVEILDLVLRHPSGRFLTEITFGFNGDPNDEDLQDLIDLLAKRAPPTIRKLHLGDYKYAGGGPVGQGGDDTEISWYSIGNLGKLWKAVPGLRTLITQGGGLTLGKIELPNLAHAELRTGGLSRANARAMATAAIPNIEYLDIWYGDDNYGGDATIKDVELLLGRTDLPALRHLGLMNSEFADALPEALARSRLLPQLRELDLSMGTMTDAGARAIAEHRDAFKHLDRLNVSINYLSKAGVAALKGVAKNLEAGQQRADEDPEYRHPAVGE